MHIKIYFLKQFSGIKINYFKGKTMKVEAFFGTNLTNAASEHVYV